MGLIMRQSTAGQLMDRIKLYKWEILIFIFFTFLGVVLTYPLIFRMGRGIYGNQPSDAKGTIYFFWWLKHAWNSGLSWRNNILIVPSGLNYGGMLFQPGIQYPAWVLTILTNEVFAYNFLVLISFPLSAITMYYLAHYFTKDRLASMLAGVIYAFCPYHILHSYCHLGLAMIQWMPLYVLFLFKLREKRTYPNAVGCGATFALVALTAYYYGFFMAIFTAIFLLIALIYSLAVKKREHQLSFRDWAAPLLALITAAILTIPFILNVLGAKGKGIAEISERALWQLESLSAAFWSYLVPSGENPIFRSFIIDFLQVRTGGVSIEHTIYLGYVPLALAVLALIRWWLDKRSNEEKINFAVPFFSLMLLAVFVFSAPPKVHLLGLEIAMPSYYFHQVLPMFQAYVRLGIVAVLMLSVLAGIGLNYLLRKFTTPKGHILVTSLVLFLLLVEFVNIPPFRHTELGAPAVPEVYKWLSGQPGDFVITEYPVPIRFSEEYHNRLFYQRIHQKKLVDVEIIPALEDADYLDNILVLDVPSVLKYLGARYVIIHTNEYRKWDGTIPIIPENGDLKLVKVFQNALVYGIDVEPSPVLLLKDEGFFSPGVWGIEDGQGWTWASKVARLKVVNVTGRGITGNLSFAVAALGNSQILRVELNGKEIEEVDVASLRREVNLESIRLAAGENEVGFSTPSSDTPIDSVLHNGDPRSASFMFADFKISGAEWD